MKDNVNEYQIIEMSTGLEIKRNNRVLVTAELTPHHFAIHDCNGHTKKFGFFECKDISKYLAKRSVECWSGRCSTEQFFEEYSNEFIVDYLIEHNIFGPMHKLMNKIKMEFIQSEWKRLISMVEPRVLAVHRAIYSATLRCPEIAKYDDLYNYANLVRGIITYRAAAIAAGNIHWLANAACGNKLENSPSTEAKQALAEELQMSIEDLVEFHDLPLISKLQLLRSWEDLFSPTGESYPNLERTLYELSSRIPHGLVCNLNRVELLRPITNSLELLFITSFIKTGYPSQIWKPFRLNENIVIVMNARADQILEALKQGRSYRYENLNYKKPEHIQDFAYYLANHPKLIMEFFWD